jgi:hypothetical protein
MITGRVCRFWRSGFELVEVRFVYEHIGHRSGRHSCLFFGPGDGRTGVAAVARINAIGKHPSTCRQLAEAGARLEGDDRSRPFCGRSARRETLTDLFGFTVFSRTSSLLAQVGSCIAEANKQQERVKWRNGNGQING